MIRIQNLKLSPDHEPDEIRKKAAAALRITPQQILELRIVRRSVDAHKRPQIFLVYTVDCRVSSGERLLKRLSGKRDIHPSPKETYRFMPEPDRERLAALKEEGKAQAVITGAGPAGLFCGLMLAREGIKVTILERGDPVEERTRKVRHFWETGQLDPDSNVQFGEGGAGTFSDGKLNTSIRDQEGRIGFILRTFCEHGAPEDILYDYQPHIGTDLLAGVVADIRREIISLGGEVRFRSCLEKISPQKEGGYLLSVRTGNGEYETIKTPCLVLAIGHSARDTFHMLHELGVPMEPKAFAVGVRVQHPQQMINDAMYGADCPYELGAAPYKLTAKTSGGRGVYSFCMCPGGEVVNASSAPGMLAVNGMSSRARDGENANSAIVVQVGPEDYLKDHDSLANNDPLIGVRFQEMLEKKAFEAGKGRIPVQRFDDFEADRPTVSLEGTSFSFRGDAAPANVREIFPEAISASLQEGMHLFGNKIDHFDDGSVLLAGVESRTSSPVRILRNEDRQSLSFPGIFPCGEGAGYAGGITSAAADGIRVAEAVLTFLMNNEIIY